MPKKRLLKGAIAAAMAMCCAVASGEATDEYAALLALGIGKDAAVRLATNIKNTSSADLAAANAHVQDAKKLMKAGYQAGLYIVNGGISFGTWSDMRDTDMSSALYASLSCEIFDSPLGLSSFLDKANPGAQIQNLALLHEMAHCQMPYHDFAVRSASLNPVASRLALAALSDPYSLWTKAVNESFADVHALLVFRQLRPEAFKKTMDVWLAKRWADAVEIAWEDGGSGNIHATQYAVLWLADKLAKGRIPNSLDRPQIGQLAFEAAVLGTAAAASQMPWLAKSAAESASNKNLCSKAALAGISRALALTSDADEKYRAFARLGNGGLLEKSVDAARGDAEELEKIKANRAALDKYQKSLAARLCEGAGPDLPISFGSFSASAESLKARLPPADLVAHAKEALIAYSKQNAIDSKKAETMQKAGWKETVEILHKRRVELDAFY